MPLALQTCFFSVIRSLFGFDGEQDVLSLRWEFFKSWVAPRFWLAARMPSHQVRLSGNSSERKSLLLLHVRG